MQRSKVDMLPKEIREELNRKLIEGSFAGFDELETWLEVRCEECGLGEAPSRSGIHRYSERLKRHMNAIALATEEAKALAEAAGDGAEMSKALTALAQNKIYVLLRDAEADPEKFDIIKASKAIAELNKSDLAISKYRNEVAERTRDVAAKVEDYQRSGGLSEDVATEIRKQILGIAS